MKQLPAIAAVLLLVSTGCGGADSRSTPDTTKTQRQRDSAVANSGLPNAGAVGKAMGIQDSAASRNAQMDSIAQP